MSLLMRDKYKYLDMMKCFTNRRDFVLIKCSTYLTYSNLPYWLKLHDCNDGRTPTVTRDSSSLHSQCKREWKVGHSVDSIHVLLQTYPAGWQVHPHNVVVDQQSEGGFNVAVCSHSSNETFWLIKLKCMPEALRGLVIVATKLKNVFQSNIHIVNSVLFNIFVTAE